MNILQRIFIDHFEEMKYILRPRYTVIENVEKMIKCGNPTYGGVMYNCPQCGKFKYVPFRCRSRFCPSCGVKYSIARTTAMSLKIVNTHHRHVVFTIAEELRPYFLENRNLLDCLFTSVNSVVHRMFYKDNKAECFTPGFICVLHTFGRDLKWNPHIHCLISEGGLGNSGTWRKKSHFNYIFLRNAFQTALLNEMQKHLGDTFKKVKGSIYRNQKNGFYVYAKPNKCTPKTVLQYIGRYLGRPVIATSRIDKYDGDTVTFHYNRHEDEKLVTETVPVLEFIERLIQHVPEKHFKMIRYYGLYARHRESDKKLITAISKEKRRYYISLTKWRFSLLISFGYDPLRCPICGTTMEFLEISFNGEHITLHEMYEKVMARSHGCRSPA